MGGQSSRGTHTRGTTILKEPISTWLREGCLLSSSAQGIKSGDVNRHFCTQVAAICPPSCIDTSAPNHAHTIHVCIHVTPSLSVPSSHHLIHNDKHTRDPHVSFHLVGLSVPTTVHSLQSLNTPHGLLFYSPLCGGDARKPAILETGLQRTGPGHCGKNTTEGQRGAVGQTRLLQGPSDRGQRDRGMGDRRHPWETPRVHSSSLPAAHHPSPTAATTP